MPSTSAVTFTNLVLVPLRPVTVTVYVPVLFGIAVIVRAEVAIPHWLHGGTITVEGESVARGLEEPEGETVAVRGTGPEKRLLELTVIVVFADPPGRIVN